MDQIGRLLMLARLLLPGRSVPIVQAALWSAAIVAVTGLVRPDLLRPGREVSLEAHSILSMDLAMSRAFCGTPSAVTALVSVTTEVSNHSELATIPARQIAAERSGSLQRFCETSTEARVNNENSLMWLESWLFTILPNASIYDLGQLLHGIRIAAAALALALMLSQGLGLVAGAITYLWLLILLHDLRYYVHAAYPFLPILTVLTATAYTAVVLNGWTREPRNAALVALAAGSWTAFAVNLRTSHLPVYLVLTGLMFAIGEGRRRSTPPGRRLQQLAMAAALFGTGYAGFQYLAITR